MIQDTALASRYARVRERLATQADVTLIAVSKTQPVERVVELYRLGHRDFGENYVQELTEKALVLEERGCTGVRWHLIGHLQSNKVKKAVAHVSFVHTVDSERIARELALAWAQARRKGKLQLFIEVNIDAQPTKSGVRSEDAPMLARAIHELSKKPETGCIELIGLMCVPDPTQDPTGAFRALSELERKCRPYTHGALSMGMSADYGIAAAEGATHVRVGTALFGERRR